MPEDQKQTSTAERVLGWVIVGVIVGVLVAAAVLVIIVMAKAVL